MLMEFSPRQHDDLDALLDRLSMAFESCFMVDEISGAIVEMQIDCSTGSATATSCSHLSPSTSRCSGSSLSADQTAFSRAQPSNGP